MKKSQKNQNKNDLKKRKIISNLLNIKRIEGNSIVNKRDKKIYFFELPASNLMLMNEKDKFMSALNIDGLIKSIQKEFKILILDQNLNLKPFISELDSIENNLLTEKQINLKQEIIEKLSSTNSAELSNKKFFLSVFDLAENETKAVHKKINELLNAGFEIPTEIQMFQLFYQLFNMNGNSYEYSYSEIEEIIPLSLVTKSNHLILGNKYHRIMKIKKFPQYLKKQALLSDLLNEANINATIQVTLLDQRYSNKKLSNRITFYKGQQQTPNLAPSKKENARNNSELFEKAVKKLQSNEIQLCQFDIRIDIVADSLEELNIKSSEFETKLIINAIDYEKMNYQQKESFINFLPHVKSEYNIYSVNSSTIDFAKLNPFQSSSLVVEKGVLLGREVNGSIIFPNFFSGSDGTSNSSIGIFGKPGQGKSYLMKSIITQEALKQTKTFIFDVENKEYLDLTENLGGKRISALTNAVINPLEIRGAFDTTDEKNVYYESSINMHLGFLKNWFSFYNNQLTNNDIYALESYLKCLYDEFLINDKSLSDLKPQDYPTFSDLYVLFKRKNSEAMFNFENEITTNLDMTLKSLSEGSDCTYFNGHTNFHLEDDNLVLFELFRIEELPRNLRDTILMNYLSFVWNYVTRESSQNIYKIFVLDELHLLVNEQNMYMVTQMKMFIKRSRKYKMMILYSTQQLSDLLNPAIVSETRGLISNPSYKILFNTGDIDILSKVSNLDNYILEKLEYETKFHAIFCVENEAFRIKTENFKSLDTIIGTRANSEIEEK